MKNQTILLRIAYRAGAIFDGIMVFPLLFPKIAGIMFKIADFNPGVETRYVMYVGASLMLGWTILLIWADRKPIERRGVILITACPVVIGLTIANIYGVSCRFVKLENMLPTLILQAIILVLFFFSYAYSAKCKVKS
jgi:predicted neutral ceramidase superfamily lipid hydrolase